MKGRRLAAYGTGFELTVLPLERNGGPDNVCVSDTDRLQIRRRDSCSGRQPPPTSCAPPFPAWPHRGRGLSSE